MTKTSFRSRRRMWIAESLEPRHLLAANPIIAEFMADNLSTMRDGYDESSDWIEIQNVGDMPAELSGWHLTDRADNLSKWTFPNLTLLPGASAIIFASGRGTSDPTGEENIDPAGNVHANFRLNADGDYLALVEPNGVTVASEYALNGAGFPAQRGDISYGVSQAELTSVLVDRGASARLLIPEIELPTGWSGDVVDFLDDPASTNWFEASTAVGFDTSDIYDAALAVDGDFQSEMLNNSATALARIPFTVDNADSWDGLELSVAYDDGFAAYLNGQLVASANAPLQLSADSTATAEHEGLGGGFEVEPADVSVLYTFEGDSGQGFTDKLTADGEQAPIVDFNEPTGGVLIDTIAANAAFGDGSLQLLADGQFNHLEIPGTADLGASFTLSAMVNYDPSNGFQRIFSSFDGAGAPANNSVILDVDPTGTQIPGIRVLIGGHGTLTTVSPPAVLNQPGYHHFAMTYDNGEVKAFVDGVTLIDGNVSGGPITMPRNLHFGEDSAGAINEGLVGSHDDILVLGTELDPVLIDALDVTGALPVIQSLNLPDTTLAILYDLEGDGGGVATDKLIADGSQNAIISEVSQIDANPDSAAFGAHSLQLTDSAFPNFNRFEIPDTANLGDKFTLALMADLESLGFQRLFSNYQGTGSVGDDRILLDIDPSGNTLGSGFRFIIGNRGSVATGSPPVNLSQPGYHHIALTYNNGAVTGYVDGVSVVSGNLGSGPLSMPLNLFVGEDPHDGGGTANEQLRGNIDDLLVLTNASLSAEDILRLATEGAELFFSTGGTALGFEHFDISQHLNSLREGENILALHGLNTNANDGDFFLLPRLTASQSIGNGAVGYFSEPTPGEQNGLSLGGIVDDTQFSIDRGFFISPTEVEITTGTPGATISYTTDGSQPTLTNGVLVTAAEESMTPSATVSITSTTTVRAVAFKEGLVSTNVDTQTYLFLADVIQQPTVPTGFPATWGGFPADYQMDPDIVNVEPYASQVLDSLQSLPSVSLVLPNDDFFDSGGIYANPTSKGRFWERETSVEYFDPVSNDEFQIDAGVRVHGGSSRRHDITPAHSLRLHFRGEYGKTHLEFPLFEDTNTTRFDTLVLDANSSDNWTSANIATGTVAQFIRNQWAKDTQRNMGQLSVHGKFVHVYVNGLYWGLYDLQERIESGFAAAELGGDKDDYDVIVDGQARDGNTIAFNEMLSFARAGDYARVQEILDVDNFIDYNIVQMFTGNWDWPDHNWEAVRQRVDGAKFNFVIWDAEVGLGLDVNVPGPTRPNVLDVNLTGSRADVSGGAISGGPGEIYNLLRQNPEFRIRFADRLQRHLFNEGELTPQSSIARYLARANEIESALVAEAARWGDVRRTPPQVPDGIWASERDWILGTFLPQRPGILLDQFRANSLFPDTAAPTTLVNGSPQHGGAISSGDLLTLDAFASEVYYTTDGTDPRSPSDFDVTTIVPVSAEKRALVPTDGSLGTIWTGGGEVVFNAVGGDTNWLTGTNGVGYDVGDGPYDADTGIDTESLMYIGENPDANPSVYVRIPFQLDQATIDTHASWTLRMRYDDAFVAYLNGVEVARANFAGDPQWDSFADGGTEATDFIDFDVSDFINDLRVGDNILAIHGMNRNTNSSDLLFVPVLVASASDASDISPTAMKYIGIEIELNDTTGIKARARDANSGDWSPLTDVLFVVPGSVNDNLRITELNYNPYPPTSDEVFQLPDVVDQDFEFIEVQNTHPSDSIDLQQVSFVDGIAFTFGNDILAAGERAVIVEDTQAFQARYGDSIRILGQWSGGLANGGENLVLEDALGSVIAQFEYNDRDPWSERADGVGATLELLNPISSSSNTWGKYYQWRGSTEFGGSPGSAGQGPIGIVINELLAHTDPPQTPVDTIEIFNTTNQVMNLGGWFVSDSSQNLFKYQIPVDTLLAPGGYLLINESDFNPTPLTPGPSDFALSSVRGDDVWVVVPDGSGGVRAFVDQVHFGPTLMGESLGRVPNGAGRLAPLARNSLGCENQQPRTGHAVISELNYNPGEPSNEAIALDPFILEDDLEYVEILNSSFSSITLTDWQLRGGITFDFASGSTLSSGEAVVILSFNPANIDNADRLAAFRAHYEIDADVRLVGGWAGQLSDSGEEIRLLRPDTPPADDPEIIPRIIEDAILYDDLAPWPVQADGEGSSLQRQQSFAFGGDVVSWSANPPSPGLVPFVAALPGDLTGEGAVTTADIDVLLDYLQRGSAIGAHDLNGDVAVNAADVAHLVQVILETNFGDANLDGVVDGTDYNRWHAHRFQSCSTWESADFNGDGMTDVSDFNIWNENKFLAAADRIPRVVNPNVPHFAAVNRVVVGFAFANSRVPGEPARRHFQKMFMEEAKTVNRPESGLEIAREKFTRNRLVRDLARRRDGGADSRGADSQRDSSLQKTKLIDSLFAAF